MTEKPTSEQQAAKVPEKGEAAAPAQPEAGARRGRSAKEPPPPKIWRVEGVTPEGLKVTLGRYATKEEAEPELERLNEDDFYIKLKIIKSPDVAEQS